MLSAQEIQQIITQNESLQAEVKELNEILQIKAEEISEYKKYISQDTELRSRLDMQLDELQIMQNHIGKQQQKATGAQEREFELQQELTQASKVNQQYSELFKQHIYITTQFEDVQEQLAKVKKRNNMLQQIAVQIGEMESNIEMLTQERDELKTKVIELEKMQTT